MFDAIIDALTYLAPLALLQVGWARARSAARDPELGESRRALWLWAVPLFLLVGLRGNVGTDTDTYRTAFEDLLFGDLAYQTFEGGFLVFARFLLGVTRDPVVAVNVLSVVIAAIILGAALRLERDPIVFILVLAPAFLLDMSMNGLRYGLAFGLAAHAICDFEQGKNLRGAALALAAVGAHASAGLVLPVVAVALNTNLRVKVAVLMACLAVLYFFGEAIALKMVDYEFLVPPTAWSGVAPLAITLSTLILIVHERRVWPHVSLWPVLGFFLLALATYGLARLTYAGIRFQFLVLFCVLVFLQVMVSRLREPIPRRVLVAMWLIGLLAFSFKMRNFFDDYGVGPSPFLPYVAVFED